MNEGTKVGAAEGPVGYDVGSDDGPDVGSFDGSNDGEYEPIASVGESA